MAKAEITVHIADLPTVNALLTEYRALRDEIELLADTWSRSSEYRRTSDLGERLRAALRASNGAGTT